jgi:hypothetical protein
MASLSIRDDLLRQVAALAGHDGISLEEQAEELLRESLSRRVPNGNLRHLMDSIAAMTPPNVVQSDTVDLLRRDRER